MAIKLVNLLIEAISEESNTDPVFDEYIPNPATGKKVKVRSALSSKQHPAYQAAKQYIQGKLTSDDSGQETAPTQPQEPVQEPVSDVENETGAEDKEAVKIEKREKRTKELEDQGIKPELAQDIIQSEEDIESFGSDRDGVINLVADSKKWNSLSDDGKKAAVAKYRTSTRSQHEGLVALKDTYIMNDLPVPEEVEQGIKDGGAEIEKIEAQEKQEEDTEGTSWTDYIDDEALKAFDDAIGFEDEETAVQFRA